jgi:isopentenyl phosphate kinase
MLNAGLLFGTLTLALSIRRRRRRPRCTSPTSGPLVVVKLGGAAITVKDQFETLHVDVLRRTARQLAEFYRAAGGGGGGGGDGGGGGGGGGRASLLLLHGAGSFGHFQAKEHGVSRGIAAAESGAEGSGGGGGGGDGGSGDTGAAAGETAWEAKAKLNMGVALTRASVRKLNEAVVDALIDQGVPAVGVSPFPAARTHGGVSDGGVGGGGGGCGARVGGGALGAPAADALAWMAPVLDALAAGLVPVVHGDVVLDSAQHCAVMGADALAVACCAALRRRGGGGGGGGGVGGCDRATALPPLRAVFMTDVDGVYDRPPALEGALRLPELLVVHGGGGGGAGSGGGGGGGSSGGSGDAAQLRLPDGGALQLRTSTLAHDVTGGLRAKLAAAVECVDRAGAVVHIVQAASAAASAALRGEPSPGAGTVVRGLGR